MRRILALFSIIIILIVSCRKILFNEEVMSREIILDNFSAVNIKGIFNIVLIQDSTNRLEISGKRNVSSIEVLLINDTLHISDPKVLSFNSYKNTLSLHFTTLGYLVTNDPVNVTNKDTIRADRLSYDAIGEIAEVRLTVDCNTLIVVNSANTLGFFHLNGNAVNSSYFNRYGCSIFADSLKTENASIRNESIGDVHINASEELTAYIIGPGNIYYYGDPIINVVERKGAGNIIKIK